MTLVTIFLLVLALYVIQLFLQEMSRFRFDLWAITGNRDNPPEMSMIAARLDRAKTNMMEALPIFFFLAFLAVAAGIDLTWATNGALIFLIARTVFVPCYVSGIPVLRSIAWLVGNVGLATIAISLIWPGGT